MTETERTMLSVAAGRLGLTLTAQQLEQFQEYHTLLLKWNQRVNLISRKDTSRIVSYHFLDSLTVLPLIPAQAVVGDLGSGAGLPGIPVNICRPDVTMLLIESLRRKALFLDEAVRRIGLEKTSVINVRATTKSVYDRQHTAYRNQIQNPNGAMMNHWTEGGHDSASRPPGDLDVILCRLLGRVAEVAAIACGLLSEQGSIIFYKSSGLDQELRQAQPVLNRLGLQVSEVRDVLLPRPANFRRRLLVITRSAG